MRKIVYVFMVLLMLLGLPLLNFSYKNSFTANSSSPKTWYVPLDFPNITSAINSPEVLDGDIIIVLRNPNDPEGAYREGQINVTKSLNIIADSRWGDVIIDGMSIGSVFSVQANNVFIKGFKITNSSKTLGDTGGIRVEQYIRNCTIRSNEIYGCYAGIGLAESSNATIVEYNVIKQNIVGIYFRCSGSWGYPYHAYLRENILEDNGFGISILGEYHEIENNILINNTWGLLVNSPTRFCVIHNNTIIGSDYNLDLNLNFEDAPTNIVDDTNTINGKKVYYLVGLKNAAITEQNFSDAGYLAIINSVNVTVRNLKFSNNGQGINLLNATNILLNNLTLSDNRYGVKMDHVQSSTVKGSRFFNNLDNHLFIARSLNISIAENTMRGYGGYGGLHLSSTNSSIIYANDIDYRPWFLAIYPKPSAIVIISSYENKIFSNKIKAYALGGGIFLGGSTKNIIFDNEISASLHGIHLTTAFLLFPTFRLIPSLENSILFNSIKASTALLLERTSQNVIYGNIFFESFVGINSTLSNGNTIIHNDFIRNTMQAWILNSTNNLWDAGPSFGGNYWSDYNGTDADGDGIGDTPYVIDENNVDHYPLINPCSPHDVAIVNLTTSKTFVGQGYPLIINITVENQGEQTETFNITVYANTTAIETQKTTITSGVLATLTFTWNTAGFAKGNYTIWAYAWPVPGETDTSDNTFTDGWIKVVVSGDVNGDGIVDIYDLILVASAFGSKFNDPQYTPNADINNDNTIDIYDLILVASNFGQQDI